MGTNGELLDENVDMDMQQKLLPTLRLRQERKQETWEGKGIPPSGVSHQLKLKNSSTITKLHLSITYLETIFFL